MSAKFANVVAVLLVVALEWAGPSSARAQAGLTVGPSCSQVAAQLDRNLGNFKTDVVDKDIPEFIKNDVVAAAGDALEPILSASPTYQAAARAQAYKENLESFQDKLVKHQATFDELERCIDTPTCKLTDLAKRTNTAVWEWLQSIGEEKLPATIQRVKNAGSLLRTNAARIQGTAQNGISAAVSCSDKFQADFAKQAAEPVNLGDPPRLQPPPTSSPKQPKPKSGAKSGGGPNTSTMIVVGAVGAGVAVAVVAKAASTASDSASQTANCSSQESTATNAMTSMQNAANNLSACGGSSSCYNSRIGAVQSTWSTAANALGNLCTCAGLNINSYISSSEKAYFQQMWQYLPSVGLDPGTMPSCFR
jgi:hypothetical protein